MAVTPIPDAPVVPQYPALGSATFNQEAYAYGTAMPDVTLRLHEIAVAARANAAAANADAAATDAAAADAAAAAASASAAAIGAESARDRAVQAEQAIEQALAEGPVLSVQGKTGIVDITAEMHATALLF